MPSRIGLITRRKRKTAHMASQTLEIALPTDSMKRTLVVALAMGMAGASIAQAAPGIEQGGTLTASPVGGPAAPGIDETDGTDGDVLETPWSRPRATYVFAAEGVPVYRGPDQVRAAAGFSNIIYLNNCKPNGCAIKVGNSNSLTDTSSIPQHNSTVSAWQFSQSSWDAVVQCVRETYGPFGVQIVDTRPAAGTNYHMAIVAGAPSNIGLGGGVGGISEFGCGYIPNAVSFSFANIYGGDVDQTCWTVAQETAHSWGLDHKFDNRDPMTYLGSGPSKKSFQNSAGSCGEFSARTCSCGGSMMNSYQEIMATFGSSTPTPPTVAISAPTDGQSGLAKQFQILAAITDDVGIGRAELRIDNALVSTLFQAPYVWTAPASLGQGNHTILVTAYDVGGSMAMATVTAAIGLACGSASDCTTSTDACVDGRCVPGTGVTGGLGTECVGNAECLSGQCGADAAGDHFCVESCDPVKDACPSGFSCLGTSPTTGVCWPSDDGGCSTSPAGSGVPGFVLFGLAGLFVTLIRRR